MMKDQRNKLLTKKMKESILLRLGAFNPSSSFTINSPNVSSFIDNRLQQVFKSFRTPDHPPYSLMIKRTMKELNVECGLTEEAISEFIRRKYGEHLPFAHATVLHIQLRKLCMNGVLVCKKGKYVLVDFENNAVEMMIEQEDKEEEEEDDDDDDDDWNFSEQGSN